MLNAIIYSSTLRTITIPASVTYFEDAVFEEASAETVILGISGSQAETLAEQEGLCFVATDLGETNSAIYGTTNDSYTYMIVDQEATITGYTGNSNILHIPSSAGGCPVTTIGKNAFFHLPMQIVEVHVPEGVTKLESRAFFSCMDMRTLTLPSTLREIGYMAVNSCDELTSIDLPNGLLRIGAHAFAQCEKLNSVSVPATVREVGVGAFSWVPAAEIALPEGVSSIEGFTFWGSGLQSFIVPESVTTIGARAFVSCNNIKEILIPSSVQQIDDEAFVSTEYQFFPSDLTIFGETGSAAEQYAVKNGIDFVSLEISLMENQVNYYLGLGFDARNWGSLFQQQSLWRDGHRSRKNDRRLRRSIPVERSADFRRSAAIQLGYRNRWQYLSWRLRVSAPNAVKRHDSHL